MEFRDLESMIDESANGSADVSGRDSNKEDQSPKRRNEWITHGFSFLIMCIVSAGAGIAMFYSYRLPQIIAFRIQFDSSAFQLQNSIQTGLIQKFAASRLLNKLFQYAIKHGYGTSFQQTPPFFTLPGFQDYATDFLTLGGSIRVIDWVPLIDTTNQATRSAWETWAKQVTKLIKHALITNPKRISIHNSEHCGTNEWIGW